MKSLCFTAIMLLFQLQIIILIGLIIAPLSEAQDLTTDSGMNLTTSNEFDAITDTSCNNETNSTGLECTDANYTERNHEERKISIRIDYAGYVVIPLFLVLGLSGNTLTIIVMLSKHFRKMSVSIILVALAFSDTTLIVLLPFNKGFVRELLGVDIRSQSPAGCKIFFWIFRSSKMTSSWFVVFLCLERFVAVWFPLKTKVICTKKNACIGLAIVYGFLFIFNGVWTEASRIVKGACIPHYPDPPKLAAVFLILGTMIYSIIPICILLVLTPLICYKLFKRIEIQQSLSTGSQKVGEEVRKTTIMLLGVSIAYMTLVAPISIAHIVFYVQGLNIFEATDQGMVIYREIAQVLEQLNYSINFFMYVLCSKSFRDRVKLVLTCQDERSAKFHDQISTRTKSIRQSKTEIVSEKSSSGVSSVEGNATSSNGKAE